MAKTKEELWIKVILDSRERDTKLLNTLKIDKRVGKDKIKFVEVVQECFKADGCKTSTGDLGFEFKFKGEDVWHKTKFSIELKRQSDIFSTLFSNMTRFNKELERARNNELDFYILHDWSFSNVKSHCDDLQRKRKIPMKYNPFLTYVGNYIKITKQVPVICCGREWEETIRRLIKKHIVENKLQYR